MNLLSLFEQVGEKSDLTYDEDTLNMLRKRSKEYLSGKGAAYTVEESMERIKQHRKHNGI
jgi:hypothetical protein